MQEAEVSLRVALYHLVNGLTREDVVVSIDGAQIKTGDTAHFDIVSFLAAQECRKVDGINDRWQGKYAVAGVLPKLIISSVPGTGDVNIRLKTGTRLVVESKKGKVNKTGQEYQLMRESIGQLMTNGQLSANTVPAVAVPYTERSCALAKKWSGYEQIRAVGIRFYLVKDSGEIMII